VAAGNVDTGYSDREEIVHYSDHPEYRELIAAICANLLDDLPRLAFADWLDERGDTEAAERAEFLRIQIRIAQIEAEIERSAL